MDQQTRRNRLLHHRWIGLPLAIIPVLFALWAGAGAPDAEILPPGVVVRQGPALTAPVVSELPGGAQVEVLFTQRGPGGEWAQIALPSGGTGFVPDQSLRRLTMPPQWKSAGTVSGMSSIARRVGQGALEIPLRRAGGTFLVPARVNSQVTTNFIVDTGAATVTISRALADKLGIDYANRPMRTFVTASGVMQSPIIVLDSIYLPDEAGAGVVSVEAAVSTLPGTSAEIGGLLGQSFLRHFRVTIEAERGVLHLEPIPGLGGRRP